MWIRMANRIGKVYFATPIHLRWVYWLFPIVYFLFPFDFLPDLIPGLGRLDDFLLIMLVFWALDRAINLKGFFREAMGGARTRNKQQQRSQDEDTVAPPHQVLGVKRNASQQEIKKAYRKLLSQYHPDKFSHLGQEFEDTARRRTQAIIAAYERVYKGR